MVDTSCKHSVRIGDGLWMFMALNLPRCIYYIYIHTIIDRDDMENK